MACDFKFFSTHTMKMIGVRRGCCAAVGKHPQGYRNHNRRKGGQFRSSPLTSRLYYAFDKITISLQKL